MFIKNLFFILFIALLMATFSLQVRTQILLETRNIESRLYLGTGEDQPLIVGLGGSEGGNAWASDYWKDTRNEFIKRGYAFLAIGYFGTDKTPEMLDRISINEVYNSINIAAQNPKINKKKIALIGGSRGGDLALLIASHYKEITCVVAIVPSHVAFPGHTKELTTSAWTFNGKELPFVPVSEDSVPFLIRGDLRSTFETMLKDRKAEKKALIKVEKINGPILLMSATKDEIAPTTPMAEKMISRIKKKKFKHHYEHIAVEGSHEQPLKHFDKVYDFLDTYFLNI